MVAELQGGTQNDDFSCSLAKISMVAEPLMAYSLPKKSCSLAKISMVAEP